MKNTENDKFELHYPGKIPEHEILESIPSGHLVKRNHYKLNSKDTSELSGNLKDANFNMLISGENSIILKILLEDPKIKGNIKLIYIDPPFATNQTFRIGDERTSTISYSNNDEKAYEDKLVGYKFLEFLRRRLFLMRELLSDDGSIYVHIDQKMGHYVKIILDEIFGENHFINDITRIKCKPKNFKQNGYGNIKDMVFFYSKTDNFIWKGSIEPYSENDINRLFNKIDKQGRRYTTNPLHAPGETKNGITGQSWRNLKPPKGRHWRISPKKLEELDKNGLIEWSNTGNPRKIIYAHDFIKKGKKRQDIWEFRDPQKPTYPTEKNLQMLKTIIMASSNPGNLILDAFCGSGTTILASEILGRNWIGIDKSTKAIQISTERLLKLKKYRPFETHEIIQ